MKHNNYYLEILPHIYYVQKNETVLLYNTQTAEYIHVQNINIINLLLQIHEKKNLGVISIDETILNQPDINVFIKDVADILELTFKSNNVNLQIKRIKKRN